MMERLLYCYGDSLTYGYAPDGICSGRYPAHIRWTGILAQRLQKENTGIRLITDGANGREIPRPGSFQMEELLENLRQCRFGAEDILLVLLGTNDVIDEANAAPEKIARRMDEFLQELKKACVDGQQILLVCPGTVRAGVDFCNPYQREDIRLTESMQKTAEKNGCHFEDVDTCGIEIGIDGVHFSEKGHREFADRIWKVLQAWPEDPENKKGAYL